MLLSVDRVKGSLFSAIGAVRAKGDWYQFATSNCDFGGEVCADYYNSCGVAKTCRYSHGERGYWDVDIVP